MVQEIRIYPLLNDFRRIVFQTGSRYTPVHLIPYINHAFFF